MGKPSAVDKPTASGVSDIKTQNDGKYDLIKFFLSLLVLAIHSTLYPMVLYPWLRIAVPLFFIMSSYFLFSKLGSATGEKQKRILKKFVVRNLQLYVCWFVILLPITFYFRRNVYFSNGLLENIFIIVRSALFGSTFVASWYIMATIIGVLMVYLLCKYLKNRYVVFGISLFTFLMVTLASSYEPLIADTFIGTAIDGYENLFGGLVCSYPAAIFWVLIGKLFAEGKMKLKSTGLLIVLLICSCIGLFLEWKYVISLDGSYHNDSYFMLAPLCILLFIGIQKIKPFHWQPSVYFKRASTIIYVTHGSMLPVVASAMNLVLGSVNTLVKYVLTLICCLIIYGCVELATKWFQRFRICKLFKMLY